MKELVARVTGSYHGGKLDPDNGRCLVHGVPCNYVVAEVPVYQRLTVTVALVSIGLVSLR